MEVYLSIFKILWSYCYDSTSVEDRLDSLKNEFSELSSLKSDVENGLKEEVLHGRKRKREVNVWLKNVKRMKRRVINMQAEATDAGKYFFLSRLAFGKRVTKTIEEVVKLREKGRFGGELFANLLRESEGMPMTKLVGMTAERNFNEILEWMDQEFKTIGVYGMGGVGKTAIMTHIYDRIKSPETIWVQVSQDSDIKGLQNSIARAIGLKLPNEGSELMRSMKLFEALKRMKKLVIILDDLRISFPLEKIGIPEDNAYKIVFTTLSKGVCRRMKCTRKFEVKILPKDEAWELFKECLGTSVEFSSEVERIAKDVTEECDGLPLAIIALATAMREKDDIREWRNTLEDLKNSKSEIEDMADEVFRKLKFRYDRLKSDRIKSCFSSCALYPEHYAFSEEELTEYWKIEGLIDDMRSREKELDKGHSILNQLIDEYWLIRKSDNCVVMHDLTRDFAIGITRESPRFVVKAGIGIRGSIGEEEFTEEVEKMSLMGNEIEMLSGEPNCPKLSTFLLQRNPLLRSISRYFFKSMNSLEVLDLSFTDIECMPSSVSSLEKLRVLLLNDCRRLRKVPSLAKLKRLKVLNLSNSCIKKLPLGMECLVSLKELYVQSTEWDDFDFDRYVKSQHWKCLKVFCLSSESRNLASEA